MQLLEITKAIEWDMGHRVPNHKHKCKHPHGHRYRLELTVQGPVSVDKGASHEGMVCDFGDIKDVMMSRIHAVLDHSFVVSEEDPIFAPFARREAAGLNILLLPFVPTSENLVLWCFQQLHSYLPRGIRISRLRLFETPTSFVEYLPSEN